MAPSPAKVSENGTPSSGANRDPNPLTIAAFSPSSSPISPAARQRSTILVHQKSPLLVATPPPITRALAFSHPFILPLNKAAGLISWTSGDPWESFLVVAGFWAIILYGDAVVRWAGPVVVVIGIILGMYTRRFSPLSSTGWTGEKQKGHKKELSEGSMRHQKSLDEIVETLTVFTTRCNVLLEPCLHMTDFLSTQRTATSATTRPALTTLFIRILLLTPIWIVMAISPLRIITTRRVVLAIGTLMLTWHSRPARVSRTVLWRSKTTRRIVSVVTGLNFTNGAAGAPPLPRRPNDPPPLPPRSKNQHAVANSLVQQGPEPAGVRFTFVVYENQRRWLGLGWTYSLMFNERAPWTDEHLNPSDPKDDFQLPDVGHGNAQWRWVEGSEWKVEGAGKSKVDANEDGWIYYDNKWNDGRRGRDGWGRYTRRRKWYRDAELVEIASNPESSSSVATLVPSSSDQSFKDPPPNYSQVMQDNDDATSSQAKKRGFLRNRRASTQSSAKSSADSSGSVLRSDDELDHQMPLYPDRDRDWNVGDDIKMGLG